MPMRGSYTLDGGAALMNDLGVTLANVRARIAKFGGQTIGEEGTNAHHDTTWLAQADGTVISSLRYDPWGVPRAAVPQGWTPFRFQGSWHDDTTDLAWVVTRWYAPSMGRFLSEDSHGRAAGSRLPAPLCLQRRGAGGALGPGRERLHVTRAGASPGQ